MARKQAGSISNTLLKQVEVEAQLSPLSLEEMSPKHVNELLHEFRVRQVELKMQNEELRSANAELADARDRYLSLYEFSPVGYITLNREGMICEINLTGAKQLGVDQAKLINCLFSQFVAPDDRDRWYRLSMEMAGHAKVVKQAFDMKMVRADDSTFNAHFDCLRWEGKGGPPLLRIVLTDITYLKLAEDVLREREEFFRNIAENGDDFIAVVDLDGRRRYNNPAYTRLFGNVEALKGTDSFAEIHPDDRERIKRVFKETVQSGLGHRAAFRFVLANGDIRYIESCGGLIKNSRGEASCVVVVSHDITASKQVQDEFQNQASYDTLTKLPNRRLLYDRLSQAMAASKRSGYYGALMFLDLDNFKPLNDAHGHAVGDLLLIEVANRLKSCVREMDTVARFGGDEFVVILSELQTDKTESTKQAHIVAEKICSALSVPYRLTIEHQEKAEAIVEHHCTASIGMVVFTNHQASLDEVLKQADAAMYQAKEAGRNLIRFYSSES